MLSNATRLRRMRSILRALEMIPPDLNEFALRDRVMALKRRATLVLQETKGKRGDPANLVEARKQAHLAHKRKGAVTEDRMLPIIKRLRAEGFVTPSTIAEELNRLKIRPPVAKKWSRFNVYALEKRKNK